LPTMEVWLAKIPIFLFLSMGTYTSKRPAPVMIFVSDPAGSGEPGPEFLSVDTDLEDKHPTITKTSKKRLIVCNNMDQISDKNGSRKWKD